VKLRRTCGSCVDLDVDYVGVIGRRGKLIRKRRLIRTLGSVVDDVDVYDVTAIACRDLSHAGV
jgi:methyl coenzyme M reductase subunit C-like uncharacterized protein (methanogenesis marker protein 7)